MTTDSRERLRFLVDAQLSPSLSRWLARKGYPSEHVNRLGLATAPDEEIEARARKTQAVVVSKDSDFADRAGQGLQVVWVRCGNLSNAQASLEPRLPDIEAALAAGQSLVEIQ